MHSKYLARLLGLAALAAICLMAAGASAAQAKYLLLLNGKSVSSMNFKLEFLTIYAKAENGLKVQCSGGTGSSKANLSEGGKKLTGSPSATLTGCKWVGSEKTCTINDGGVGQIKLSGNDEMVMPNKAEYNLTGGAPEIGMIITEGALCTIPEEEPICGTASFTISNALENTTVKLGNISWSEVTVGPSKITELVGEMHVSDLDEPNATFAIHLVEL